MLKTILYEEIEKIDKIGKIENVKKKSPEGHMMRPHLEI